MHFLFELFPIILFFIVFKIFNIYIATFTSIIITILQIIFIKIKTRKIDTLLLISFVSMLILGTATLLSKNLSFIKWKPTIFYWFSAIFLSSSLFFGKQPLRKIFPPHILDVPTIVLVRLTLLWIIFLIFLGVMNIIVAFNTSIDFWVKYKIFGSMAFIIIFIILQSIWLSKYLKNY